MRIYVSTYHKYASGSLKGEWLDTSDFYDKEGFLDACREIHQDENDPEFMFQDFEVSEEWEKEFISESYFSDEYFDVVDYFESFHDSALFNACLEYLSNHGYDLSKEKIENCYENRFLRSGDDRAEIFERYFEETGGLDSVPENLRNYIDFDSMARDEELSGYVDFIEVGNSTYEFSNC